MMTSGICVAWSDVRPNQPGTYIYAVKDADSYQIIRLYRGYGGEIEESYPTRRCCSDAWKKLRGFWAGPISGPNIVRWTGATVRRRQ